MPYITQAKRSELETNNNKANNPGELNYLITTLIEDYKKQKGLSYQTVNDVVGALEGAKLEFYRRVAVPYENYKLAINGDVYDEKT